MTAPIFLNPARAARDLYCPLPIAGSIPRARSPRRWSPTATRITRAAAMGKRWRRLRHSQSWSCATLPVTARRRYTMAKLSRWPARSPRPICPPAMCSDRRRSCSNMRVNASSSPAITNGGRPDLRVLRRHPVRHLHHRGDLRPAGLHPPADCRGDWEAARRPRRKSRFLVSSSVPMRWARRSG